MSKSDEQNTPTEENKLKNAYHKGLFTGAWTMLGLLVCGYTFIGGPKHYVPFSAFDKADFVCKDHRRTSSVRINVDEMTIECWDGYEVTIDKY